MLPGKVKPQLRAWSLQGAPKSWDAQDVMQCLEESGATNIEILRPPGKIRAWLVKAIVPDETDLGVVVIQAGHHTLFLNRTLPRSKRKAEVISVINAGQKADDTVTPTVEKPVTQAPQDTERRERSPRRANGSGDGQSEQQTQPTAALTLAEQPRYDPMDCGGAGDCGYLCVAAALAFEKGEHETSFKDALGTRARTIRNDAYKHLAKHKDEYKEWFVPDSKASEEQEAGSVPTSWDQFLESTLRPHRWICGLSLLAISRRYGVYIVVVPTRKGSKHKPMCFGQPKSGKQPIVLLLEGGHYQLARLRPGRQWPKEWLTADQASITSPLFRGGVNSWRPSATPDSKPTMRTDKEKWRPACTPEAEQPSASRKESTKRKRAIGPSLPASSSTARQDCLTANLGREGTIADTHHDDDLEINQSPEGNHEQVPPKQGRPKRSSWACPDCKYTTGTCKTWIQRKRAHILAWHPDRLKAMNLKLRQDKLVPWSAKCVWKCPLCNLGILPSVKPSVRYSLRIEHHKIDHPDADARLFRLRRSVANIKKATVAKVSAGVAKRLLEIKAGKQGDHQVVFLSIPCTGNETKKRNGLTRVACAKCTALAQSVAGLAAISCEGEKRAGPKRGQLLARMRHLVDATNVTEQQRSQAQQVLDVLSPPQTAEQPVVHEPIRVDWPVPPLKHMFVCKKCKKVATRQRYLMKTPCGACSWSPRRASYLRSLHRAAKTARGESRKKIQAVTQLLATSTSHD